MDRASPVRMREVHCGHTLLALAAARAHTWSLTRGTTPHDHPESLHGGVKKTVPCGPESSFSLLQQ